MRKPIWFRLFAIGIGLTALLAISHQLRAQLGIEFSVPSMRARVDGLGLVAPVAYLALFAGRQFLAIPTIFLIPVAGLCFGLFAGTLLATLGLLLNAVSLFLAARFSVRGGVQARTPPPDGLVARIEAAGPWLVASVVLHPTGPLTPTCIGAGLSSMSLSIFSGVTLVCALFRCLLWAFFGSTLADMGSPRFWIATGILGVAVFAPLIYGAISKRSTEPAPP